MCCGRRWKCLLCRAGAGRAPLLVTSAQAGRGCPRGCYRHLQASPLWVTPAPEPQTLQPRARVAELEPVPRPPPHPLPGGPSLEACCLSLRQGDSAHPGLGPRQRPGSWFYYFPDVILSSGDMGLRPGTVRVEGALYCADVGAAAAPRPSFLAALWTAAGFPRDTVPATVPRHALPGVGQAGLIWLAWPCT